MGVNTSLLLWPQSVPLQPLGRSPALALEVEEARRVLNGTCLSCQVANGFLWPFIKSVCSHPNRIKCQPHSGQNGPSKPEFQLATATGSSGQEERVGFSSDPREPKFQVPPKDRTLSGCRIGGSMGSRTPELCSDAASAWRQPVSTLRQACGPQKLLHVCIQPSWFLLYSNAITTPHKNLWFREI